MNRFETKIDNVETASLDSAQQLAYEAYPDRKQQAEESLQKLSSVARTQPEQMYKSVMQLEELIADTTDDPKTQGKAFLSLARCFIGIAGNKTDRDPEGARICLYGTPTGRMTPDHNGRARGYDGAIDALKEASKRLPRDNNILVAEEMTVLLARKLQR